ncbi:MAG TPA: glycosyltransferase [Bryobacteraceae bacterium]|nr:glycosyltransferase [Bryobacteraceae bacterium]
MSASQMGNSATRVLDVWSHVAPEFGGVGPAAAGLAMAVQQNCGWQSRMLAVCDPAEDSVSDGIPGSVEKVAASGPRPAADMRLRPALDAAIQASDVVHVHGLWLPHSVMTRLVAAKFQKPLVSSVHGMLEAWELKNKWLKKAIYAQLFERRSLARSHCLRALSAQEAADYRRFGLKCPIAVVPNGISQLERTDPGMFLRRFPHMADKSIVLFLSRMHFKKGILNLLQAWPAVLQSCPQSHLAIAGPDCQGTQRRAKEIIGRHNLHASVTFCGTLNGETKLAALSAARLFCLPSYSEGQSVAVLEALSIGLPVVITAACNVDGVSAAGAGVVTSNDPAKLAASLIDCLSASPSERQAMGNAGRALARTRFDWSVIGRRMHAVYSWMLGGPRPAWLVN